MRTNRLPITLARARPSASASLIDSRFLNRALRRRATQEPLNLQSYKPSPLALTGKTTRKLVRPPTTHVMVFAVLLILGTVGRGAVTAVSRAAWI